MDGVVDNLFRQKKAGNVQRVAAMNYLHKVDGTRVCWCVDVMYEMW